MENQREKARQQEVEGAEAMTLDEKMMLRRAFKRLVERIELLEEELAVTQKILAEYMERHK